MYLQIYPSLVLKDFAGLFGCAATLNALVGSIVDRVIEPAVSIGASTQIKTSNKLFKT